MIASIISCIIPLLALLQRVNCAQSIFLLLSYTLNSYNSYKNVKYNRSCFSHLQLRNNSSLSYIESISLSTMMIGAVSTILPKYVYLFNCYLLVDMIIGILGMFKRLQNRLIRHIITLVFPIYVMITSSSSTYFILILLSAFLTDLFLYRLLPSINRCFSLSEMVLLLKFSLLFLYILLIQQPSITVASIVVLESTLLTIIVLNLPPSPFWVFSMIVAGATIELATLSKALGRSFIPWFIDWLLEWDSTQSTWSYNKIIMLIYWFSFLFLSISFASQGRLQNEKLIIQRKYFHFLAVLLFLPCTLIDVPLMQVSFAFAYLVLLLLEIFRITGILPLNDFMTSFIDSRDNGPIILTHFSLLIGCALPIWVLLDSTELQARIGRLAGIVSIGLGDSFAAIIGSKWGRHKIWGNKTIEGFMGFSFASILCIFMVCYCLTGEWNWSIMGVVLFTAIEEVVCEEIDNYVLSMYFLSLALLWV